MLVADQRELVTWYSDPGWDPQDYDPASYTTAGQYIGIGQGAYILACTVTLMAAIFKSRLNRSSSNLLTLFVCLVYALYGVFTIVSKSIFVAASGWSKVFVFLFHVLWQEVYSNGPTNQTHCQVDSALNVFFIMSTLILLILITIERYLSIVLEHKLTRRATYLLIGGGYFLASLSSLGHSMAMGKPVISRSGLFCYPNYGAPTLLATALVWMDVGLMMSNLLGISVVYSLLVAKLRQSIRNVERVQAISPADVSDIAIPDSRGSTPRHSEGGSRISYSIAYLMGKRGSHQKNNAKGGRDDPNLLPVLASAAVSPVNFGHRPISAESSSSSSIASSTHHASVSLPAPQQQSNVAARIMARIRDVSAASRRQIAGFQQHLRLPALLPLYSTTDLTTPSTSSQSTSSLEQQGVASNSMPLQQLHLLQNGSGSGTVRTSPLSPLQASPGAGLAATVGPPLLARASGRRSRGGSGTGVNIASKSSNNLLAANHAPTSLALVSHGTPVQTLRSVSLANGLDRLSHLPAAPSLPPPQPRGTTLNGSSGGGGSHPVIDHATDVSPSTSGRALHLHQHHAALPGRTVSSGDMVPASVHDSNAVSFHAAPEECLTRSGSVVAAGAASTVLSSAHRLMGQGWATSMSNLNQLVKIGSVGGGLLAMAKSPSGLMALSRRNDKWKRQLRTESTLVRNGIVICASFAVSFILFVVQGIVVFSFMCSYGV
ncbi:hypothetical protein BC828DRAFT_383801 [Blastocladiella britannica]|nr:hypothetical protein BC828DRAFT_383801 [Blastocladiella britannica]